MSRRANWYDNPEAESLVNILKHEAGPGLIRATPTPMRNPVPICYLL